MGEVTVHPPHELGPAWVVCAVSAAAEYRVPANILLAVAQQEGGQVGQWVANANGSHDVGVMQFNTAYIATLSPFGIEPQDVAQSGCYPYRLAAWRIRQHLRTDSGDIWTRVANFHSRTPALTAAYRDQVITKAAIWAQWLSKRATVYDMRGAWASGAGASVPHNPKLY